MFNGGNADFSMPVVPAGYGSNGGNDGWGDNGAWWIIVFVLFFAFGGCGNGGWGGNGGNGVQSALTRGDLCQDMNFNDLQSGVRNINDSVNVGFANLNSTICHQQYDTAQLINGVQMQMANEFRGTDNAVCQLGYQTQQGFNETNIALMQGQNALSTQIADCCCRTQSNLKDIQFQNAQDTCAVTNTIQNTTRDIIDNQNANSRQILDFLVNDKISTLQTENQNLKLAASQAAQNSYLLSELKPCPSPAYITCNPFTGQYGGYGYNGYNNGCGCNSGCCGCNG